ncbi:MAG: serine protease [Xanthobacteraceae bacterium]|nr:serine protease [Xanthobacteraceae bacterium]
MLTVAGVQVCRAQAPDDTLQAFAVHVARTPLPDWGAGAGIYLGNGMVLTAAHVVGQSWLTRPRITVGAGGYPTRAIKEGRFEDTDLTLLAVDDETLPLRLRLRRLALCAGGPWPGEEVVSVTPEAAVRTRIIAPDRLPPGARRFDTVMADVVGTGNSGSGVFDAKQRCLLGIVSRKISLPGVRSDHGRAAPRDIAKYFVPASAIAAFLPPAAAMPVAVRGTRPDGPVAAQ